MEFLLPDILAKIEPFVKTLFKIPQYNKTEHPKVSSEATDTDSIEGVAGRAN